jgi:restriction endonuclease Mrr
MDDDDDDDAEAKQDASAVVETLTTVPTELATEITTTVATVTTPKVETLAVNEEEKWGYKEWMKNKPMEILAQPEKLEALKSAYLKTLNQRNNITEFR